MKLSQRHHVDDTNTRELPRPLVLHILPTLESGGAERFVYDVAKRLPAKGFDVGVVSIVRGGPLKQMFIDADIPLTVLGLRGIFGFSAMRALYMLMKRERPSVVHTHLFGADVWGGIAAVLAGVPVVISTEHNVNVAPGKIKRRIKGWMSGMYTKFIAVAHVVKMHMITREYIPKNKICVIANGIDITRVIKRSSHGFHDIPRLVAVGRLVPQKGYPTLLKALALVQEPWKLDIIGTGPMELELRALAERLSIASRIQWSGFCGDVPQRLAESDVFLFSSYSEGFGLALLEAVVAGVPCIASDLPVFHEFLSGEDVTFVQKGDVPAFAQAIRKVLANPSLAIQQAHQASERIGPTASIDTTVASYAKLYHQCLQQYENSSRK